MRSFDQSSSGASLPHAWPTSCVSEPTEPNMASLRNMAEIILGIPTQVTLMPYSLIKPYWALWESADGRSEACREDHPKVAAGGVFRGGGR